MRITEERETWDCEQNKEGVTPGTDLLHDSVGAQGVVSVYLDLRALPCLLRLRSMSIWPLSTCSSTLITRTFKITVPHDTVLVPLNPTLYTLLHDSSRVQLLPSDLSE